MEKEIKKLLCRLKCEYVFMWAFACLLIVLYECDVLPQGVLVEYGREAYIFQMVCMLLTLGLIYMALRLLRFSRPKHPAASCEDWPEQLVSYRRLSEMRLALLFVPASADLTAFYATFNTGMLLCAGMVAVASLFCIPGKSRLKSELGDFGMSGSEKTE